MSDLEALRDALIRAADRLELAYAEDKLYCGDVNCKHCGTKAQNVADARRAASVKHTSSES